MDASNSDRSTPKAAPGPAARHGDVVLEVAAARPLSRSPEIDTPSSPVVRLTEPLPLDCGQSLAAVQIAYKTYGTLNADKSNAILVCHALTGDQHVASDHPVDRQARLVGRR